MKVSTEFNPNEESRMIEQIDHFGRLGNSSGEWIRTFDLLVIS